MTAKSPTLVALKKHHPEAVVNSMLVKILKNLIEFFNVGKSMNDMQVAETVKLIAAEYYFLKLEDLKLCFDGMKKGKYLDQGKLFDRLDGQIILMAIKAYTDERLVVAQEITAENHKQEMLAQRQQPQYIIMVGDKYLVEVDEEYDLTKHKDLAHKYSQPDAIAVAGHLEKCGAKKVKVLWGCAPDIGKIKEIRKQAGLYSDKDKYEEVAEEYNNRKKAIEADTTLTDFEKHNKIRALSGLKANTEAEYREFIKALIHP